VKIPANVVPEHAAVLRQAESVRYADHRGWTFQEVLSFQYKSQDKSGEVHREMTLDVVE
jgi:hypothetical protein